MAGKDLSEENREKILLVAATDMEQVIAASQALIADSGGDHQFRRALETAMVICYARPFAEARGFGQLKGKGQDAPPEELHGFRETHDRVIRLRNKVYAHTDIESGRDATIVVTTDDDGNPQLAGYWEQWTPLEGVSVPDLIGLAAYQRERFRAEARVLHGLPS